MKIWRYFGWRLLFSHMYYHLIRPTNKSGSEGGCMSSNSSIMIAIFPHPPLHSQLQPEWKMAFFKQFKWNHYNLISWINKSMWKNIPLDEIYLLSVFFLSWFRETERHRSYVFMQIIHKTKQFPWNANGFSALLLTHEMTFTHTRGRVYVVHLCELSYYWNHRKYSLLLM